MSDECKIATESEQRGRGCVFRQDGRCTSDPNAIRECPGGKEGHFDADADEPLFFSDHVGLNEPQCSKTYLLKTVEQKDTGKPTEIKLYCTRPPFHYGKHEAAGPFPGKAVARWK